MKLKEKIKKLKKQKSIIESNINDMELRLYIIDSTKNFLKKDGAINKNNKTYMIKELNKYFNVCEISYLLNISKSNVYYNLKKDIDLEYRNKKITDFIFFIENLLNENNVKL